MQIPHLLPQIHPLSSQPNIFPKFLMSLATTQRSRPQLFQSKPCTSSRPWKSLSPHVYLSPLIFLRPLIFLSRLLSLNLLPLRVSKITRDYGGKNIYLYAKRHGCSHLIATDITLESLKHEVAGLEATLLAHHHAVANREMRISTLHLELDQADARCSSYGVSSSSY